MIQRSDFEDYYFDNVLATSNNGVFLIARAYPEEGSFMYIINRRGDPQTYSYYSIDVAIEEYNRLAKKDPLCVAKIIRNKS